MSLTVPFERALYPPSTGKKSKDGPDIVAVKRAISRLGYWEWREFDDSYSNAFAKGGVAEFQRHNGIAPTGNYGKTTHQKLIAARIPDGSHAREYAFDQYSINLYKGYEDLTDAQTILADIWKWWDWLVAHEPSVHYSQMRPIYPLARHEEPPKLPTWLDCSGTFTYAAWLAGAHAPDAIFGFSGGGNTESLQESGFAIAESEVDKYCKTHYVGCFYGPNSWDTHHICAVKNRKEVYSHGQEGGPDKLSTVRYGNPYPVIGFRAYRVL